MVNFLLDIEISFGGFTQLVEMDLGPIPGPAAREVTPQQAGDILQEQERSNSANVIFRTASPLGSTLIRGC